MTAKKNKSTHKKSFSEFIKLKTNENKNDHKSSLNEHHDTKSNEKPHIYSSLPEVPDSTANKKGEVKIQGNFISRPRWAKTDTNNSKRPLGALTSSHDKKPLNEPKRPLGTEKKSQDESSTKIEQKTPTQQNPATVEIEKIDISKHQTPRKDDQTNSKEEEKATQKVHNVSKTRILEETLIEEPSIEAKTPLLTEGETTDRKVDKITPGHESAKLEAPEAVKQLPATEESHQLLEENTKDQSSQKEKESDNRVVKEYTHPESDIVALAPEKTPDVTPVVETKNEESDTKELAETIKSNRRYIPMSKKSTFCFVVFVLLWAAISMVASQFVLSVFMQMILKDNFTTPLWTTVYDALVYIMTLILVIAVPPKMIVSYRRTQIERKQQVSPSKEKGSQSANDSIDDEKTQNRQHALSNVFFKHDTEKVDLHNTVTQSDRQNDELATSSIKQDLTASRQELGLQGLPNFVDLGLAPIGYAVYLALASVFSSIMSTLFTWFNTNETQNVGFSTYLNDTDKIIAIIALVFLAPIAEEIIFRGWVYGKLRSRLKLPLAILLTSLLFAVLHGQWNVGVSVFALSLVLCGLREVTGTIWSGIILHMLSNGIAFYLLYVAMI